MVKTFIHIGEILGINLAAITLTYVGVEDWLKILGLILAATYTTIKIYKEVKTNA